MKTAPPRKGAKALKQYGKGAVRYSLPKGFNGPMQIQIDFRHAVAPQSFFYADSVSVSVNPDLHMATLSFGQKRTGSFDRIEVVMPKLALFKGFWDSVSGTVEQTIDEALSRMGVKAYEAPLPDMPASVMLYANIIHFAVSPADASLDFYCMAPRDVHLARMEGADISLQPMVRVFMSVVLAKFLLNQLRPYAEKLTTASNRMERKAGLAAG